MMLSSSAVPAPAAAPAVKEVTAQNFMQEVMAPSAQGPVLVYFTAAWCGPCKSFGPLLEKTVAQAKGAIRMVRVDIDKSPQLAQQFRIQSVPMVYIVSQGQPVDGFAGVLPESEIRQIIAQWAGPDPAQADIDAMLQIASEAVKEGQWPEAEEIYAAILSQAENVEATAGLARCLIARQQDAQAEQLLAALPQDKQNHEAVASARAALSLARQTPASADAEALSRKVEAAPDDHAARFEWALSLFSAGRQEEAITQLLLIVARDRQWNDEAARKQLLTFFESLGFAHPLAAQGRRKLSSILFA